MNGPLDILQALADSPADAIIPPKFTPGPEARCAYCRTIADHPTHCQSCGAPR